MNKNHLLILLARQNRKQNIKQNKNYQLLPSTRIYNLNITRDDPTKLHYKKIILKVPLKIPIKIDLRYQFPPVYDQGNLGSCTANAFCSSFTILSKIGNKNVGFSPSRLYFYYCERVVENSPSPHFAIFAAFC